MKKLIVANWKENPSSPKEALRLFERTWTYADKTRMNAEVVICPPFVYLYQLSSVISRQSSVKLGAQDVSLESGGAHTGEVSPAMLKNSGVEYVIVGHSERRALGETDGVINKKIKAALKVGLKPILCVGEPSRRGLARTETRLPAGRQGLTRNEKSAKSYVKKQLEKDLKGLRGPAFSLRKSALVVAYEPIWAISTNKNAKADNPNDSLEMIKFIKDFLSVKCQMSNVKCLYGGSVTSHNAQRFLQYKEVNGALVGGASLKAGEFVKIIRATE